ncbi:carbonic anhydrase 4-like isoform X2 [Salarias fasciatus]|uniref:carbonic anhydrase 4-like isoform X2 n=1 Tax=Salarias fasciatus TaxID=181472 RepID=UPI00117682E7|nr:carbonic anhydrase 4-like isoform X2 [Salarias fasciatus]
MLVIVTEFFLGDGHQRAVFFHLLMFGPSPYKEGGRGFAAWSGDRGHTGASLQGSSEMKWLVASAFVLCVLVPKAQSASDTVVWCYHLPSCNYTTWPVIAAPFCNGTRQSPIDINTSNVTENANLGAFTFHNYSSTSALTKIENTGRTIKVTIADGVGVSGGGLGERYDSLQFHLHWGNGTAVPGSEHTVDGKQFAMELHIVNSKGSLNGNTTLAVGDPSGLAALGFFIEPLTGSATGMPDSWRNLTSYFQNITMSGQSVTITHPISLDSLLNGVSLTNYYRYNGSLTTPACNEAVVWTVFNDTIKISEDLINLFSQVVRINDSTSPLMVNVYRGVQSPLPVHVNPRDTGTGSGGGTSSHALSICSSLGLLLFGVMLSRV